MEKLTAHLVRDPAAKSGPDADALVAARELRMQADLQLFGHSDFVPSQEAFNVRFVDLTYNFKRLYVLKRGSVAFGSLVFFGPRTGNASLGRVEIVVPGNDPEVLSFGYKLADAVASEMGRSVLITYVSHATEPPLGHPHHLAPPTGIGAVDSTDPHVACLLANGWAMEQTERYSVLRLPAPVEIVKPLEEKARAKASEAYELVQWISHTPEEYLESYAFLHQSMSTAVPHAGLVAGQTSFDEKRIRHYEEQLRIRGTQFLVIAAKHKDSDNLVGFTRVDFSEENLGSATQRETLVLNDHRGHNLGLWLKSVLVQELVKLRPQAARIHTWNAGENSYMLNINVALGFTKLGIQGAWQKRLS